MGILRRINGTEAVLEVKEEIRVQVSKRVARWLGHKIGKRVGILVADGEKRAEVRIRVLEGGADWQFIQLVHGDSACRKRRHKEFEENRHGA